MTKYEREVVTKILAIENPYLVGYTNPRGINYFRLRTGDHRPLMNVKKSTVSKLRYRYEVIDKEGDKLVPDKWKLAELKEKDDLRLQKMSDKRKGIKAA